MHSNLKPFLVLALVAGSALAKQHLETAAQTPANGERVEFTPGTLTVDHAEVDLEALQTWVETLPEGAGLQVEGYWCLEDRLANTTTDELLEIAETRASVTRQLLIDLGMPADRVSAIAFGPHAGGACRAVINVAYDGDREIL